MDKGIFVALHNFIFLPFSLLKLDCGICLFFFFFFPISTQAILIFQLLDVFLNVNTTSFIHFAASIAFCR